jgi:multiple sugar transport system substrate-binding protein
MTPFIKLRSFFIGRRQHGRFGWAWVLALGGFAILAIWFVYSQLRLQILSNNRPPLLTQSMRLLLVGDPFAFSLQAAQASLSEKIGVSIEIEIAGYQQVRELLLQNAKDTQSQFDVVSFDVVWLTELIANKSLGTIDDGDGALPDTHDFLPQALLQSQHNGRTYGLPVQPHPELLWVRGDLLKKAGLAPPRTTDDLLRVAKRLNKPDSGQYGICWNGQRGQALGQQMAHWYAAFGLPLLDANGRPALNNPNALQVARFAQAMLKVSSPDVLNMAWDQRAQRFARGGCAMTYEWAARTPMAEQDPGSLVAGKVIYLAAPHALHAQAVTPLGIWSLGLPANLGDRRDAARSFLIALSSPESQRLLALSGNAGMPRLSLLNDPYLQQRYPAFNTVAQLSREGQLATWMRPAVPQWAALAELMGEVFHDMLDGALTPEQAVAEAQQRAEKLFVIASKTSP